MSARLRWAALGLASSLVCMVPLRVEAAPDLAVTTKDTPKKQRKAHATGRKAAEAGDASGAVEAWAAVLEATPESTKTRRFRMNLIVDTVRVALDAHAQSPDVALLERTLDVYYAYFAAYEQQYGNPNIPSIVVDARFDLKAALETAQREVEPPPPPPAPEPPPPEVEPPPAPAPAPVEPSKPNKRDGTGLMVAGGVTAVVGLGLTSLIAVGAINGKQAREDLKDPRYSDAQRARIDDQGKQANAMLIAGLVSAPVVLATGAVLLGLGAKRHVASKRYAVTPSIGPGTAGLQLQGRF